MKIARLELSSGQMIGCFMFGLVPGFVAPVGVWLYRGIKETEVHEDFWLGVMSSYGVAIVMAVLLFAWWGGGIATVTEEQMFREQKQLQNLETFQIVHNDPVFGVPLREDGYPTLEILAGSRGEGSYCRVKPPLYELPPNFKALVFHHVDGFHERQRALWQRIMKGFNSLWETLLPQVNSRYQNEMNAQEGMSKHVSLESVKIGKDVPGLPLSYMLSIEYDQDAYADVWCVDSNVTKVEFWM